MNNQEKFKNKYRIQSNRLQGYDYSSQGAYFVTICTKDKDHFFGEVENEKMILNELGKVAEKCWMEIPDHFPDVVLDEFVIMPNHVHGIFFLFPSVETNNNFSQNHSSVETKDFLSLQNERNCVKQPKHGTSRTIGSIVRGFKIGVTKYARQNSNIQNVWQANYHDRIVRNDIELNKFREYIINNPRDWEKDDENLIKIKS